MPGRDTLIDALPKSYQVLKEKGPTPISTMRPDKSANTKERGESTKRMSERQNTVRKTNRTAQNKKECKKDEKIMKVEVTSIGVSEDLKNLDPKHYENFFAGLQDP